MNYFLKLIARIKSDLEKVENYIEGKTGAANYLDDTKDDAAFNLRFEKGWVILEDNSDDDRIFEKIEEMGVTNIGTEKQKEEEILPTIKEGSISKRIDGRWMGRYYDNGDRKYVYSHTKKDVINKLNKAVNKRNQRSDNDAISKNIKLKDWIKKWLKLKEENVKESTMNDYKTYLVNQVSKDKIGNKSVSKITVFDISKYMAKIKKPSAKARAFRHFKSCFSGLVKHRVLKENIFDYIDSIPEPSSKKAYAPEKSELMDFFSKLIKEDYETYIFAKFLSLTGLRKGEALALTWDDFDGELLKVDKAFNVVSRKVTTTKTKAGNRTIPLIPAVIKLLESLRSNNKEIFWFIPKYYVTHKFTAYAKKYELERLTLHTLRHYFTTQCYEAGIPEKVVSLWLGHSKSIVTNQVYTHINKKFETEQINIIAEYWDDEE